MEIWGITTFLIMLKEFVIALVSDIFTLINES